MKQTGFPAPRASSGGQRRHRGALERHRRRRPRWSTGPTIRTARRSRRALPRARARRPASGHTRLSRSGSMSPGAQPPILGVPRHAARAGDVALDGGVSCSKPRANSNCAAGRRASCLTRDGEVIVRGVNITSRAAASHRIRGASVQNQLTAGRTATRAPPPALLRSFTASLAHRGFRDARDRRRQHAGRACRQQRHHDRVSGCSKTPAPPAPPILIPCEHRAVERFGP